jgi:hypothetical protein
VHDCKAAEVTVSSFEKTKKKNGCDPKYVVDLEGVSNFIRDGPVYRGNISQTRNNRVRSDFKKRKIAPTHWAMPPYRSHPGENHQEGWLIETVADGESLRGVVREEEHEQLNNSGFTATFAVVGGGVCRFVRLVNIGRNHCGGDSRWIYA